MDTGTENATPATGPAMLARRHQTVRTEGVYRNAFADGVVEVTRFDDATVFDAMHAIGQISHTQHNAAAELYGLWVAAGLSPRVCGGYGRAGGRALTDDGRSALDDYRAAVRLLTAAQAWAVSDVLWGSVLPAMRVQMFRDGLDVLVREWGL